MDKLLEMSAKELDRLEVMQRLEEKRLSQKEAGRILDLSVRQIKRLLRGYREKGAGGLVSKHRGRKANHRLPDEVKKKALNLLKTKYQGFGPTLAHENRRVDPEKWTVVGLGKGAKKCPKAILPIRRNFGNRSWN